MKKQIEIKKIHDESYEREFSAVFVGIFLLFLSIVMQLEIPTTEESRNIVFVISILIRIGTTMWVVFIAGAQNRNKLLWGIITFSIPPVGLIIIGSMKKLRVDSNLYGKQYLSSESENNYQKKLKGNNNATFSKWKEQNPGKSLNDFYTEIKMQKQAKK